MADVRLIDANALRQKIKKTCSTCKWHDSFSWVCFNGLSEHRADFTDPEDSCQWWEAREKEDKNGQENF